VFSLVKRVLRDDGVLWLVIGDAYAGSGGPGGKDRFRFKNPHRKIPGLPRKNLIGIPWRVAFALQAAGWVLRSDIIWFKESSRPEFVRDRPSNQYEHIFMFAKNQKYKYFGGVESVWIIPPVKRHGPHGARFPAEIPRRCMLASTEEGDTILDPFAGSGTTMDVCTRHNRSGIGIELNPECRPLLESLEITAKKEG
jgi:DNA modification methylase